MPRRCFTGEGDDGLVKLRASLNALATRYRHRCVVLNHVCASNQGLVTATGNATTRPPKMQVRDPIESGATRWLTEQYPFLFSSGGSLTQRPTRIYSRCVPLVWLPTWSQNFGENFMNSVVGLDEMLMSKTIDAWSLLLPDMLSLKRRDVVTSLAAMRARNRSAPPPRTASAAPGLLQMLAALLAAAQGAASSAGSLRPKEGSAGVQALHTAGGRCFEHAVFCQLRSVHDSQPKGTRPWGTAQRMLRSLLQHHEHPGLSHSDNHHEHPGLSHSDDEARLESREWLNANATQLATPWLRVLFINRTGGSHNRRLLNLPSLLEACNAFHWTQAISAARSAQVTTSFQCSAHEFGRESFRHDALVASTADVLIGVHGAALQHAFFMRRGSSAVEVRPCSFEGPWPDAYLKRTSALERAVLYHQISMRSPELCSPRPPAPDKIGIFRARELDVWLPWRSLRAVLRSVLDINGSQEAYNARQTHVVNAYREKSDA